MYVCVRVYSIFVSVLNCLYAYMHACTYACIQAYHTHTYFMFLKTLRIRIDACALTPAGYVDFVQYRENHDCRNNVCNHQLLRIKCFNFTTDYIVTPLRTYIIYTLHHTVI